MSREAPDELNYETSEAANLAIVRALGEIRFAQRVEALMPLIARELVKAGVDFSKARMPDETRQATLNARA